MDYHPDRPDYAGQPPELSTKIFLPGETPGGNPYQANEQPTQMYDATQQVPQQDFPPYAPYYDQPQAPFPYPQGGYGMSSGASHPYRGSLPSTSGGPISRLRQLWNRDPAYKVLLASIGAVILAMFVFVALVSAAWISHSSNQASVSSNTSNKLSNQATPPKGQTGTAQQPTATPSPTPSPTPVPPTPTPSPTPVTPTPTTPPPAPTGVQITNVPQQVTNGQVVPVSVTAAPGSTVYLVINYNGGGFQSVKGPKTAGGDGTATFNWHVQVFVVQEGGNATATLTAYAVDGNGNRSISNPVQVTINR